MAKKDNSRFDTIKKYMEEPKPKKPRHQIDYIISSADGKMLCVTLCSADGKDYYLKEFVNMMGLSPQKLKEMMDMGYASMLEGMKKIPVYQYINARS